MWWLGIKLPKMCYPGVKLLEKPSPMIVTVPTRFSFRLWIWGSERSYVRGGRPGTWDYVHTKKNGIEEINLAHLSLSQMLPGRDRKESSALSSWLMAQQDRLGLNPSHHDALTATPARLLSVDNVLAALTANILTTRRKDHRLQAVNWTRSRPTWQ